MKEARIAYGIANVSVGFTAAGLLKHYKELKKTGELVGKGTLIDEVVDDTGIPQKNQIEKPAGSPAVGGSETRVV